MLWPASLNSSTLGNSQSTSCFLNGWLPPATGFAAIVTNICGRYFSGKLLVVRNVARKRAAGCVGGQMEGMYSVQTSLLPWLLCDVMTPFSTMQERSSKPSFSAWCKLKLLQKLKFNLKKRLWTEQGLNYKSNRTMIPMSCPYKIWCTETNGKLPGNRFNTHLSAAAHTLDHVFSHISHVTWDHTCFCLHWLRMHVARHVSTLLSTSTCNEMRSRTIARDIVCQRANREQHCAIAPAETHCNFCQKYRFRSLLVLSSKLYVEPTAALHLNFGHFFNWLSFCRTLKCAAPYLFAFCLKLMKSW